MTAYTVHDHLTAATMQAVDDLDRIIGRIHRADAELWLDYNPEASIPFGIHDGANDDVLLTMRPTLAAALTWIFTYQQANPGTRVDRDSIRLAHERADAGFSLRVDPSERELTEEQPSRAVHARPALALVSVEEGTSGHEPIGVEPGLGSVSQAGRQTEPASLLPIRHLALTPERTPAA